MCENTFGPLYHQMRIPLLLPQFCQAKNIATRVTIAIGDQKTSLLSINFQILFMKIRSTFQAARAFFFSVLTISLYDWQEVRPIWQCVTETDGPLLLCYLKCGTRRVPRGK